MAVTPTTPPLTEPGRPRAAAPVGGVVGRAQARLWRSNGLRGLFTLSTPLLWFLVIYLASLVAMLVTAFFTTDDYGNVVRTFSGHNFWLLTQDPYPTIIWRTVVMAAAVTVTDAIVAIPFAFFLAKVLSTRARRVMLVLVLLPLWASYLARVYAWVSILEDKGLLANLEAKVGLPHTHLIYSWGAMWVVFCYLWLPFMIVPIFSAFERVPDSLLEASADLGAGTWTTFRRVLLPLVKPGIAAGSIFTFSLTLGDFITPLLVGGTNSNFIGNTIYDTALNGGNLPLAAALAFASIVIMALYLLAARFAGAFEAL